MPGTGYLYKGTTCLDTGSWELFSKNLVTRQSEILTNFLEIACLIPLRT